MDEEGKAIIEATVHEAAAPYRKVAEVVLGYAFLDRLEELREERRRRREEARKRVAIDAIKTLHGRKAEPNAEEIAPEFVEAIMAAVDETSSEELQQLFAKLLAAAIDPARKGFFRKEFVEDLKQFDPVEAVVLQAIAKAQISGAGWVQKIAKEINRVPDEVEVSGRNLERLGLVQKQGSVENLVSSAFISARGRQLLACLAD